MNIFLNGRFFIRTYDSNFLNVKISDTKESHEFRIQECNCYVHDGNCRVSFVSEENGKYLKIITLFEYEKSSDRKKELRGKSFLDFSIH